METQLAFTVVDNCSDDFRFLDLSYLNLKIYKLEGEEFKSFLSEILSTDFYSSNYETFQELYSNQSGSHMYRYVLVPINLNSPVDNAAFRLIELAILVMFPCDFRIINIFYFDYDELENGTRAYHLTYWEAFRNETWGWWHKNHDDGLLQFDILQIEEINSFLKLSYSTLSSNNEIAISFDCYRSTLEQHSVSMCFINLFMALESLLDRGEDISKRLRKMVSGLIGHSAKERKIISNSITYLYEIRSSIVHGGKYIGTIEDIFHLRAIVSRTLVELIASKTMDRESIKNHVRTKNQLQLEFNKPIIELSIKKIAQQTK